jgi:hypothetical protein
MGTVSRQPSTPTEPSMFFSSRLDDRLNAGLIAIALATLVGLAAPGACQDIAPVSAQPPLSARATLPSPASGQHRELLAEADQPAPAAPTGLHVG